MSLSDCRFPKGGFFLKGEERERHLLCEAFHSFSPCCEVTATLSSREDQGSETGQWVQVSEAGVRGGPGGPPALWPKVCPGPGTHGFREVEVSLPHLHPSGPSGSERSPFLHSVTLPPQGHPAPSLL